MDNSKNPLKQFSWAIEIEVNTTPQRKGAKCSLSDAEILLDALTAHRHKQIVELEALRDSWVIEEDTTLEKIRQSVSSGDFSHYLDTIKVCNVYIDLIAAGLGHDLRKLGEFQ